MKKLVILNILRENCKRFFRKHNLIDKFLRKKNIRNNNSKKLN